jgi:tetratricopeptide (TPR) repeat protein
MRVALVVGSSYEKNGQLTPLPSADLDCELMERRLSDRDAGFRVFRFGAERGLAERIEQRLLAQTEAIDHLLVYFSGYCAFSAERGPALLLDGERLGTFAIPRLRKLLDYFSPRSCVILDAAAVLEGEGEPAAVVDAVGAALVSDAASLSVLVAARRREQPDSFGGSAFTGLVLMVIDWLAGARAPAQALTLRWLYDGLLADSELHGAIPALGLFPEHAPFELLPARAPAEALALPRFESSPDDDFGEVTPAFASASRGPPAPPPVPPVPRASEPLPSFAWEAEAASAADDGRLPAFSASALSGAAAADVLADLFGEGRATRTEAEAVPQPPARAPMPSFAPSVDVADALFEASEFSRAADEYEAALALIPESAERLPVLVRQAAALLRAERLDEAARALDEASTIDGTDVSVLRARAEHALALEDFGGVAEHAAAVLDRSPEDRRALELSALAAEALGDPRRAVAARQKFASIPDGSVDERAHALFEASRLAESGLGDQALARSLVTEGLALAPARLELLDRASSLFGDAGQHAELFAHYERAIAESHDRDEVARLAFKLEELAQAGGVEPSRLARALERVLAVDPGNLPACDRLVELYAAGGAVEPALGFCRRAARLAPTRARTYRRALALFESAGATDGAWNAASVLDCLGEADINEALLASQHKPEGLLAVRESVAYAEWQHGLLASDFDPKIWDLLDALGPSGIRVGVGFAKHQKRYVEPDPALYQDPEKSTTMLAKTLGWTARLLRVTIPALYVLPDLGARLDVGPTEQAAAFASRNLASGLGLGQLTFLWGRQLPRFRNELRALAFFRSPSDLGQLVTAALALGECPGVSVRALDGDAKRLYAALRREVRGPAFDRVRVVARDFPAAEVDGRVRHTLRGIELIGVRAGLVACGDVAVAAELVRRYPTDGMTHADEQLAELYTFAISDAYGALRRQIGVAVAA